MISFNSMLVFLFYHEIYYSFVGWCFHRKICYVIINSFSDMTMDQQTYNTTCIVEVNFQYRPFSFCLNSYVLDSFNLSQDFTSPSISLLLPSLPFSTFPYDSLPCLSYFLLSLCLCLSVSLTSLKYS